MRHPPTRARPAVLLAVLLAGAVLPARALADPGPSGPCEYGRISAIFVDNNSVFDVGSPELDPRFNWAYRTANRLHVRTREEVIRRELLFREGDCYNPALLEDSERILRGSAYISDADVFAVRQADGSYHVVVETQDEWSFRLEPQVQSGSALAVTGAELREDNLLGTGQRVAAFYRERDGERTYGAEYGNRQFLRTHLDAELGLARTPVGVSATERLAYPFRGETGRWAVRQQFESLEHNFEFFVPDSGGGLERRLFAEERRYFDVGGVLRLGQRGNLTMFGAALAGEWIAYPRHFLAPDPDRRADDPGSPADSAVFGLDSVSNVRLVVLAGQRNVYFARRTSLDAVRATEDVRLGVEVEMGIGRSLEALSTDNDLSVDLGFFAAGELPGGLLSGVRAVLEGKRDFAAPVGSLEWTNVFGQLDAWSYWRPSPESRHTFVGAVSGVGGWRTTIPFQLTLGNRSGMRGLPRQAFTGERRVVATLEHRMYLGWPYPKLFDLGSAAFVDAGKIWAGGDQFGMDSPLAVDVGAGLRLAFPPGSRRTYRFDMAVPVTGGRGLGGVVFTFAVGQAVGRDAVRDDPQLRRSSRRAVTTSVFRFPD